MSGTHDPTKGHGPGSGVYTQAEFDAMSEAETKRLAAEKAAREEAAAKAEEARAADRPSNLRVVRGVPGVGVVVAFDAAPTADDYTLLIRPYKAEQPIWNRPPVVQSKWGPIQPEGRLLTTWLLIAHMRRPAERPATYRQLHTRADLNELIVMAHPHERPSNRLVVDFRTGQEYAPPTKPNPEPKPDPAKPKPKADPPKADPPKAKAESAKEPAKPDPPKVDPPKADPRRRARRKRRKRRKRRRTQ